MFPKYALVQYLFLGKAGKIEQYGLMKSNGKGYYLIKDEREPLKTTNLGTYRPGAVLSSHFTLIAWDASNPLWKVQSTPRSLWKKISILSMITVEERGNSSVLPAEDLKLMLGRGTARVVSTSKHRDPDLSGEHAEAACSIYKNAAVIEQDTDQGYLQSVLELRDAPYTSPEIPELQDKVWKDITDSHTLDEEVSEVFSVG